MGIIGVDNDEVGLRPRGPAAVQRRGQFRSLLAYEAAGALDCLMKGKVPVPSRIVAHPTHIAIRRSTDVVAIEDQSIAKALRFIHGPAGRQEMTVADVARNAGISLRLLEKRFRRELGCSVLDEIRRMHTDKMAQLLVETHLSVQKSPRPSVLATPSILPDIFALSKK